MYRRAREAGLSALRAIVLANIASFRDGWAFKKNIAKFVDCCSRTVQRAIDDGKTEGMLDVARNKPTDIPAGWKLDEEGNPENPEALARVQAHGFSHRWVIGRGKAGEALKRAICYAKATRILRPIYRALTAPASKPPAATPQVSRYGREHRALPRDPRERKALFNAERSRIAAQLMLEAPSRNWTVDQLEAELERALERIHARPPPD